MRILLRLIQRGRATTAQLSRDLDVPVRTLRSDLRMLEGVAPVRSVGQREKRRWEVDPGVQVEMLGMVDRIALQLGGQLTSFLRGTILNVADFAPLEGVPQRYARHLDRKLRLLREPARSYADHAETLDTVLDALLRQFHISFVYTSSRRQSTYQHFQPLTLVMYRRALYLLGRAPNRPGTTRLSLERISSVERGERFDYPSDWRPDKELEPWFGINASGRIEPVALRFSAKVAPYVRVRCWHPTQRLVDRDDGGVDLHMHTGGVELERFALEWGQHCEVLDPPHLRESVRRAHEQALEAYRVGERHETCTGENG